MEIQGIKFEKFGTKKCVNRRTGQRTGKEEGQYKAIGPTGNVIFTNDFNEDLSTSSKKHLIFTSIRQAELISADYIRLKEEKAKDFYEGKCSLEEASTMFYDDLLLDKEKDKEKIEKLQKLISIPTYERTFEEQMQLNYLGNIPMTASSGSPWKEEKGKYASGGLFKIKEILKDNDNIVFKMISTNNIFGKNTFYFTDKEIKENFYIQYK